MPAYTDRPSTPNARFSAVMPDGRMVAVTVAQGFADSGVATVYLKWPGHDAWIEAGSVILGGSDYGITASIIQSGGLWNTNAPGVGPTWSEISAGAGYLASNGQTYAGSAGVSRKMADWLATATVASAETATDAQWTQNILVPQIQALLDTVANGQPVPPAPPVPVPGRLQYPPQNVGGIPSAFVLLLAQGSRLQLVPDPASPNRVLVSTIPVPV